MQLLTAPALGSVHVIAHLAGQSCGHLDGLGSVLVVTHACIYDIVGLHNVYVFLQVVGTEVFDIWVLQTACSIFEMCIYATKCIFKCRRMKYCYELRCRLNYKGYLK